MPRIAAAIGVVVLCAFSIGFNTMRYPVVWEMVGAPAQLSQSSQSSPPAENVHPSTPMQPIPDSGPAMAGRPIPLQPVADTQGDADDSGYAVQQQKVSAEGDELDGTYTEDYGSRRLPPSTGDDGAPAEVAPPPVEAEPAIEYACGVDPPEVPNSSGSPRHLVPVTGLDFQAGPTVVNENHDSVHRLPPVEGPSPITAGPMPIYPSTGVE